MMSAADPKLPLVEHIVLAELVALRTIVLNLQFALASGEILTPDTVQRLIERADHARSARLRERFASEPHGDGRESDLGSASRCRYVAASTTHRSSPPWCLRWRPACNGHLRVQRSLDAASTRLLAVVRAHPVDGIDGFSVSGKYRLLQLETADRRRLALDEEVAWTARTATLPSFVLSDAAIRAGVVGSIGGKNRSTTRDPRPGPDVRNLDSIRAWHRTQTVCRKLGALDECDSISAVTCGELLSGDKFWAFSGDAVTPSARASRILRYGTTGQQHAPRPLHSAGRNMSVGV